MNWDIIIIIALVLAFIGVLIFWKDKKPKKMTLDQKKELLEKLKAMDKERKEEEALDKEITKYSHLTLK